jgi:hypothetical protein
MDDDGREERHDTDDRGGDAPAPGRPRGLPPTPTPATLTRALQVCAGGAVLLFAGVAWLALGVCDAGRCPVGPGRTAAEATATVGFLVLLGAGAYAVTAGAHLLAVRRRDRRG